MFFFGSITALFVLYGSVEDIIPLWMPLLISTILSLMWVLVALNIRATTRAWQLAITEFENNENPGKAFRIFEKKLSEFSRLRDLRDTIQLWTKEPYIRVTRLLTLLGVLSAAFFFLLFVLACMDGDSHLNEVQCGALTCEVQHGRS